MPAAATAEVAFPDANVIAAPAVRTNTVAARGLLAKRTQSATNTGSRTQSGGGDHPRRVQREELQDVRLDERHRPQDEQHGEADDERRPQPSRARV